MAETVRRTKIVASLEPAADHDNSLDKIIKAGANVVRFNFSHGAKEDHIARAEKSVLLHKLVAPTTAVFASSIKR